MAVETTGDIGFIGVDMRVDPGRLSPGLVSEARNMRFRDGVASTRLGVTRPVWLQNTSGANHDPYRITPWGKIYGLGVFRDPNSILYYLIAADGKVYWARENNTPVELTLPRGVGIWADVQFVQSAGFVMMLRGVGLPPLLLNNIDDGFLDMSDIVSASPNFKGRYDPAVAYDAVSENEDIVSWGTEVGLSTAAYDTGFTGSVITYKTTAAHGFKEGSQVDLYNDTADTTSLRVDINLGFVVRLNQATATVNASTITVDALSSALSSGDVLVFPDAGEGEGKFELDADAAKGDTTLTGLLTVADVLNNMEAVTGHDDHFRFDLSNYLDEDLPTGSVRTLYSAAGDPGVGSTGDDNLYWDTTAEALWGPRDSTMASPYWGGAAFNQAVDAIHYYKCSSATTARDVNHPTSGSNWDQVYTQTPNGVRGVAAQNRILFTSNYKFAADLSGSPTAAYDKTDFVFLTDFLDPTTTYFTNHMRINQGSDDELVDVASISDNEVICFKDRSVFYLTSVTSDSGTTPTPVLKSLISDYGLSAKSAFAVVGRDVLFMSDRRGVVSLRHTEQGEMFGVDEPISKPIQPLIDSIDWRYGHKIRMAYWDNKLFVAVPLGSPYNEATENVFASTSYPDGGLILVDNLIIGQKYRFEPGVDAATLGIYSDDWTGLLTTTPTTSFSWTTNSESMTVQGPAESNSGALLLETGDYLLLETGDKLLLDPQSIPVTSTIKRAVEGENNAILVYDFLNKQWSGVDYGSGAHPAMRATEFLIGPVGGVSRLLFADADGYINLMEEAFDGDDARNTSSSNYNGREDIDTTLTTRGYRAPSKEYRFGTVARLNLATWKPSYTISYQTEGVNETQTLVSAKTKSNTRYTRPFTKVAYDATNVNDDHGTAYREDYSLDIDSGISAGSGFNPNRLQDFQEKYRVSARESEYGQIKVVNTQGRIRIKEATVDSLTGQGLFGSKT